MGTENGECDLCAAPIGWQDDGDRYVVGWHRINPTTGAELFACRLCALEATVLMLSDNEPVAVTSADMTAIGMCVDMTVHQLRGARRAILAAMAWGPRDPVMCEAADTLRVLIEHSERMYHPNDLTINVVATGQLINPQTWEA
jgi:hypothetical protein